MTVLLKQDGASATLAPERGGLLESLRLESPLDGGPPVRELLWLPPDFSASGSGWPGGGAPVLFPLAGRCFHEGQPLQYSVNGTVRHMPLHGFAYGVPWTVKDQDQSSATLVVADSAGTRELYPFAFELKARYELAREHMTIKLEVKAGKNAGPMPVNLGLHPFFLGKGRLEVPAEMKIRVTPTGAAGKAYPFPENDAEREARTDEPTLQSLIFADLQEPRAALRLGESLLKISLEWNKTDPFRYVVVYSRPGEGFYCIEPWMGLPDAVHTGLGVKWLKAGESLGATVKLSLTAV